MAKLSAFFQPLWKMRKMQKMSMTLLKNGKEADESFIQIYQQLLIPFPILFNGPII